jgi:hypothetical protein
MSQQGLTTPNGGNGTSITKVAVDAFTPPGTNPVLATSGGKITVTGGQVAAGTTTNVIQTNSLAANTFTIQVQRSQAVVSSTIGDNGVCHFNSADFSVDSNGFVSFTGSGSTETLTGNSGGAVGPSAGNINTVGTGSLTVVGTPLTNTLTFQLTGLTNHAVLVGAGTATITNVGPTATTGQVLQNNSGADPSYSTATYPSTTTINQILYSSATNVVSGLATANQAVLTTGATGIPVLTALATNGQLIIGSTAGVPAAATLTAGTGISITNGSNSITIAATGTTTLTVTPLTHAASPYTVLTTDDFLAITGSVGTFTVQLPNAPATGRVFVIKDSNGSAATFNIAVTTVGGTVTIDGQTTYTMATNFDAINVIFDGSNYEVF